MDCVAGRCRCPPGARPTADRQHCLRPAEKLLRQPCSPTFDTCLHKSGTCRRTREMRRLVRFVLDTDGGSVIAEWLACSTQAH